MINIAIIPARGGSKGIINKNLQKIGGLSLVAKAIRVCFKSKKFNEIFVSTDSPEIAKESKNHGAKIIIRPKDLAKDTTSTDPVISHAIEYIEKIGINFNYISLIQATYPFLTTEQIKKVVSSLKDPFDCAFASSNFHGFIWENSQNGFVLANRDHNFKVRPRRQDQQKQFLELGSIYVIKKSAFLKSQSRFGTNPYPVIIENTVPIEIDNYFDLEICRSLVESKNNPFLKTLMKKIKHIITDFDGVLTDNTVFTDSNGIESVICNKSDSLSIGIMRSRYNIKFDILTSEESKTHQHRAKKMGLNIHVAKKGKADSIRKILNEANNKKEGTLYIGNDLNDLDAFHYVEYVFCPNDSHKDVQFKSDIILNSKGGQGIFRELLIALESS